MFGGEDEVTLNEESLFDPKSPYAASKVFAHHMTRIYRESYDMFCVNGILFNHEFQGVKLCYKKNFKSCW